MTLRTRTLIAAIAAAFLAPAALAGEGHRHVDFDLLAQNDPMPDAWRRWAEDFSNEMCTSMGTMFANRVGSSRIVKNAPYSAEIVTENNQALADGNVISKKTSSRVYRDAQGRTREEVGGDGKTPAVYINDPVAGQRIILSPGSKRAIVSPRTYSQATFPHENKQLLSINGTEIRIEDGKVFIDGKEVIGKTEFAVSGKTIKIDGLKITVDGKEVMRIDAPKVVMRTITTEESGDGTERKEVRVQIVKNGEDKELRFLVPPTPPAPPAAPGAPGAAPLAPLAPMPPLPGASLMRFDSMGKLGKGTTTKLGSKTFDGVNADGTKTTWTIPAGEIGNRAAINVVSEMWFSPELQVTVYSRYSDPRHGESIYRLSGIKRAEPAQELFNVPEGYEKTSKETAREKSRAERERQQQLQRLDQEQKRLELERERLQRERDRLKG